MKALLFMFIVFGSLVSQPLWATIKLRVSFKQNFNDPKTPASKESHADINVSEGESATFYSRSHRIELTPSIEKKSHADQRAVIKIKFKIYEDEKLVAAPSVTTPTGLNASIRQMDHHGNDYHLSVTPEIIDSLL